MTKRMVLIGLIALGAIGVASAKTVKILAVGNSFSSNALTYFRDIVKAAGHEAIVVNAYIGGCEFARHVRHVEAYEKDPSDPEGRPYRGKSLWELLKQEEWEYVTVQQVSYKSVDVGTFQPDADKLLAYIRKGAPQAEIVVHQTWAYGDHYFLYRKHNQLLLEKEMNTPLAMYRGIRRAYDTFCKEKGFRLIPCGDAFETARTEFGWGASQQDLTFDRDKIEYPQLPQIKGRTLYAGRFLWKQNKGSDKWILNFVDGTHANKIGCYLLGCVWFEFFLGESVVGNTFVPESVGSEDCAMLQRVAHRVTLEGKRPEL